MIRTRRLYSYGALEEVAEYQNDFSFSELVTRVSVLEMRRMHHAGGDDIDLHAAMMLQGLKNAQAG